MCIHTKHHMVAFSLGKRRPFANGRAVALVQPQHIQLAVPWLVAQTLHKFVAPGEAKGKVAGGAGRMSRSRIIGTLAICGS